MDGQTAKQPNKHTTTLVLITLWPQRQSTSSAADFLSPSFPPLDVTWITTSRLPSAPWGSAALPLERLYVIKNETAKQKKKSWGNNLGVVWTDEREPRKMGEDEVRQGVRGLCNLVWLPCEKTERSKMDRMKTQRSAAPLKQIAAPNLFDTWIIKTEVMQRTMQNVRVYQLYRWNFFDCHFDKTSCLSNVSARSFLWRFIAIWATFVSLNP